MLVSRHQRAFVQYVIAFGVSKAFILPSSIACFWSEGIIARVVYLKG